MNKTNPIRALIAVAVSGLLAFPAVAQQLKGNVAAPAAGVSPAQGPTSPVAPARPAPAPVAEVAMPVAVPAPLPSKPEKAEPPVVLKYRDPSKPLTIGEMSDIQAADETEKFLKKHGFTSRKPEAAKTASGVKGDTKPAKPLPPLNTLKVVGVYGVPGKLRADLQLNGALVPVDRPVGFGKAQVRSIDATGIEISLPRSKPAQKCAKKKEPSDCKAMDTVHRVRVGDVVEWR